MNEDEQAGDPTDRLREEIPAEDLAGIANWMLRQRATNSAGPVGEFTPPSAAEMDEVFDGFSDFEFIGAGGMGAVYRAHQTKLGRDVAIKILSPAKRHDTGFRERFAREALSMAQLSHPNIVAIYETGERGELFYIVMEYVPGTTLRTAMAAGTVSPERAIEIARDICAALGHAHEKSVLHRDIKPANILLRENGLAMLTDFGLAKLLDETKTEFTLTLTDAAYGTPAYMAPEQSQSMRDVDARADLYSLGVVLYEMLTGHLPAGRFSPPPVAAQVVMKALDNDPAKRFANTTEMDAALASSHRGSGRRWLIACAAIGIPLFVYLMMVPGPNQTGRMNFVPLAGTNIEFCQWETRVSEWAAFVSATGYEGGAMYRFDEDYPSLRLEQNGASWQDPGFEQTGDHPVVGVSWHDAVAFCEWLTTIERKAGRLPNDLVYRLPTDREWSIASSLNELPPDDSANGRANLDLADFLPWDEQAPPPDGIANFADDAAAQRFPRLPALSRYTDGHAATAPVGSFPADANGRHDMLGNVWEWTGNTLDENGDATFRGASWTTGAFRHYLPGLRMRWSPDLRRHDIGFRIVRAPAT